jgi:hypothetical protein
VEGNRKRRYVQKVVRIPVEDAEWFDENYPMYGSWAWLIQTSLANFRALHEFSANDLLSEAVKATVTQKATESKELE